MVALVVILLLLPGVALIVGTVIYLLLASPGRKQKRQITSVDIPPSTDSNP